MKKQHLLSSLLILFLALACSDGHEEEPTPPNVEIPPSITIPSTENEKPSIEQEGGTVTVAFTTSDSWTASIANDRADSWLSVSPTNGNKGDSQISITAKANETPDDRNATITLKCGTASKNIVITQKQKDALTITSAKYEVKAEGGIIDVEVKANVEFDFEIKADWIKEAIETRSLTVHKKRFQVLPNESGSNREGEITFKSGSLSETIKIYQDYNHFITLTQREFMLSDAGGMVDVEIKSSVEYGIKMLSGSDWITEPKNRAVSTHTLHYIIAPNDSYDSREAQIAFFDRNDENIADTVSIYQAFKGAIIIARNEYEFDATGGSLNLKLQSNLEFNVTFSADWIQQATTRALTEYDLHFNILSHESKESREGEITVKAKDRDITQVIKVKQSGKEDYAAADREALIALYKATNGDSWKNKTNWCSDKPLGEWYGVQTNQDGKVSSINIPGNQLDGSIPDSFFSLSDLTWINFEGNNLTGNLSEKWGDFTNATFLGLAENQFTGSIPNSFANLINLTYFSLSHNKLTGSIPSAMEQMPNWEKVIRERLGPQLPGYGFEDYTNDREILIALYKATNGDNWKNNTNWCSDKPLREWYGVQMNQYERISYLNLPWNQLDGSIPDNFFSLSNLTWINFEGNNLTGNLSEKWGNFTNASFLGLGMNQFTGSIPNSFANLTNLTYFSLLQNKLTGPIPNAMEQMPNWEKVINEQLEPQQPGYGFTGEATTQMIDLGNNLFLHPEGFAIELRYGKNAILSAEELQQKMKYLYTKFNDDFDFLCYVHNVQNPADLGGSTNAGEFMTINNSEIQGLGNIPQNDSGKFGSDGKLKGMIAIFSRNAMGVFLHEFAHYYGAIDLGQSDVAFDGTVGLSPVHWGVSSVNGQLGGFDINTLQRNVDNNPQKYRATCSASTEFFYPASISGYLYPPLELYIMGLIPKEEVPDTYVYDGVSVTTEDTPWNNGVFYAEKERKVTIDDIIAKYGERLPNSKNSQKSFRVITVVFTANPITDREWKILKKGLLPLEIKGSSGLENYPSFWEATGGRATLQIGDLTNAMHK